MRVDDGRPITGGGYETSAPAIMPSTNDYLVEWCVFFISIFVVALSVFNPFSIYIYFI